MMARLRSMTLEDAQFVYEEMEEMYTRLGELACMVGPCFGRPYAVKFEKLWNTVHTLNVKVNDCFWTNSPSSTRVEFDNWSHQRKPRSMEPYNGPYSHRLRSMPKEDMELVFDELNSFEHRLVKVGNVVGPCFGARYLDRFIKLKTLIWSLKSKLEQAWYDHTGEWLIRTYAADNPIIGETERGKHYNERGRRLA
jgi:hypothetical protein